MKQRRGSQLATLDEVLSPTSSPPGSEANFGRRMSMGSMSSLARGGSFGSLRGDDSQSVSSLSVSETDFDERESLLLNARSHSKDLQACSAHPGQDPNEA